MSRDKSNGEPAKRSSRQLCDSHGGPGIRDAARGTQTRAELRSGEGLAQHVVDTIHDALLVLRKDLRVEAANRAFYEAFRVEPEETIERSVFEIGGGQWDLPEFRKLLEEILPEDKELEGFEVEQHFEGLGRRVMLLNARQLDDHDLVLLAIEDITEERRATERLEAVNEELQELNEELEERVERRTEQVEGLASALAEAEEQERERIAEVLHDDVQQLLYGAELSLRAIRRRTGELPYEELRQELQERLGQLGEALGEAQEATRALSAELSPPLLQGENLEVGLEWLVGHFEERYGLPVEVDLAEGFDLANEPMRRFLFQLTRELLFNTVKHAGAPKAYVEGRRRDGRLLVYVRDEGKGFDKEEVFEERPEGRGLRALQNRLELLGGGIHIDTAPGDGTCVTASIPVGAEGG